MITGDAWRSDYQNVLVDQDEQPITDPKEACRRLEAYKHADWYGDEYEKGEYIKGLIMKVNPSNDSAEVRFGRYSATITSKDMGRSGKRPGTEFKPGLLAEFDVKEVDEENKKLQVTLSQVPEIQAAIVSHQCQKR